MRLNTFSSGILQQIVTKATGGKADVLSFWALGWIDWKNKVDEFIMFK